MSVQFFFESSNHRTFIIDFFGTSVSTTVTSTPSVVRKWIRTSIHRRRCHLSRLVVGLGVQWRPNANEQPATLQLCIGRRCLLFQLIHSDRVPNSLRRFLSHSGNTFVGIWNHSDALKLKQSKHELVVHKLLDLRLLASRIGEILDRRASFETIAREVLGYEGARLVEWISRSNWDEYNLSDHQVVQASMDAHVSFEIGKKIRAWNI